MKKIVLVISMILLCFSSCGQNSSQEAKNSESETITFKSTQSKFPKSIGLVNDYSNIFSSNETSELQKLIRDYEIETTNEIAVVTVNSIEPYEDIQLYSTELGQTWGVGKKDKNNGLIIVFCKPLRKISISTGYGTEKILTDPICKKVIDSIMIPKFIEKDFYGGIKEGVEELIVKWE